jgi:hypothetical protein
MTDRADIIEGLIADYDQKISRDEAAAIADRLIETMTKPRR